MNPETELPEIEKNPEPPVFPEPPLFPEPIETRFLKWMIFGADGVRVGWSVALFLVLDLLFHRDSGIGCTLLLPNVLDLQPGEFTPASAIVQEALQFLGLLAAAAICALIERRRVLDYNLSGPNRTHHFFAGLFGGFLALTTLVGALNAGGWLHFGAVSLGGVAIFQFAALWAVVFLLTGLGEEGMTRCYMLFTLARGINYWWALGSVASLSLLAWRNSHGAVPEGSTL